ncbi:Bug family tripartite tricarboxylate transporter substrate binding protein [Glaciimonas soli]|uniref:Tripartite tricarboxylate transporter substrate binding protein n=1 Tax=Glaciimonas soli TaxID=2590999 RepID=A0A843YSW9_9BURK|nr:tripartite tricarboxylate transporter substrate-binding protein [Glaciimonas soli]MQR00814.1 tripartite tricarboxylate transporter substrate binding protein [Glaciimonas soli]
MTSTINWIAALGACVTLSAYATPVQPAARSHSTVPSMVQSPVQCIAPAKPGGGMSVTCKLIQKGLQLQAHATDNPIKISYMPGGVGAVAWNSFTTQKPAEANTLVVFSGGSLLNLAQGKYGEADVRNVRWVAAVGIDYGMVAVRSDSPYKTLRDLLDALKKNPSQITIGASGTVGSQDWLKISMLATQHQIDPKNLRFVALEGGGEEFTALHAGHIQVVSGDASEASLHAQDGEIRVLAVFSDQRLPGALANVPTARELGMPVSWSSIRGVYMGPQVSDADYKRWVGIFDKMMATPEFDRMRASSGLYPFAMSGEQLTRYVKKSIDDYRKISDQLGLIR